MFVHVRLFFVCLFVRTIQPIETRDSEGSKTVENMSHVTGKPSLTSIKPRRLYVESGVLARFLASIKWPLQFATHHHASRTLLLRPPLPFSDKLTFEYLCVCCMNLRCWMLRAKYRNLVWHLLLSYYSTVVCTTTCNGRNYCRPRDPASWKKIGLSVCLCSSSVASLVSEIYP